MYCYFQHTPHADLRYMTRGYKRGEGGQGRGEGRGERKKK